MNSLYKIGDTNDKVRIGDVVLLNSVELLDELRNKRLRVTYVSETFITGRMLYTGSLVFPINSYCSVFHDRYTIIKKNKPDYLK